MVHSFIRVINNKDKFVAKQWKKKDLLSRESKFPKAFTIAVGYYEINEEKH